MTFEKEVFRQAQMKKSDPPLEPELAHRPIRGQADCPTGAFRVARGGREPRKMDDTRQRFCRFCDPWRDSMFLRYSLVRVTVSSVQVLVDLFFFAAVVFVAGLGVEFADAERANHLERRTSTDEAHLVFPNADHKSPLKVPEGFRGLRRSGGGPGGVRGGTLES
jgi:hypothetical protein